MGNKLKQFFMNSWTVTVGGGLILSFIISVINDFVNKEQVFSTIDTILSSIYKVLLVILNYKIKMWWLLLGIIVLILILMKYLNYTYTTSIKLEFLEYTQDIILDINGNGSGKKIFMVNTLLRVYILYVPSVILHWLKIWIGIVYINAYVVKKSIMRICLILTT